MLALEIYLGLVLVAGLLVVWKLIAHWLGGGFRSDPYPPEAAEAPPSLDEHFNTAPRDELEIDWHRYEYEMRKQT